MFINKIKYLVKIYNCFRFFSLGMVLSRGKVVEKWGRDVYSEMVVVVVLEVVVEVDVVERW